MEIPDYVKESLAKVNKSYNEFISEIDYCCEDIACALGYFDAAGVPTSKLEGFQDEYRHLEDCIHDAVWTDFMYKLEEKLEKAPEPIADI
jgi:hypothetical protein